MIRFVSILAHPGGRALLDAALDAYAAGLFQSSPTPEGGRYLHPQHHGGPHHPVSILAHPGGRALPATGELLEISCDKFQSSPTPEGGRYIWLTAAERTRNEFQSSPTPEGGRYGVFQPGDGIRGDVSILAHPGGRALRLPPLTLRLRSLFQSSPTPEGGRYA